MLLNTVMNELAATNGSYHQNWGDDNDNEKDKYKDKDKDKTFNRPRCY